MAKRTTTRVRLDDDDDGGVDRRTAPRNILTTGGPGRPLGSTNLVPRSVKQAINDALAMHPGGAAGYLFRLSNDHPSLFVSLLRRSLPVNLRAELDAGSLMSKLLQVSQAARAAQLNGASNVINVTPTPTRRRFAFEEDS